MTDKERNIRIIEYHLDDGEMEFIDYLKAKRDQLNETIKTLEETTTPDDECCVVGSDKVSGGFLKPPTTCIGEKPAPEERNDLPSSDECEHVYAKFSGEEICPDTLLTTITGVIYDECPKCGVNLREDE